MHYEFTDDAIELDGMQAFRIQALLDMPEFDITEGELGGYVTKDSTISRKSWVDGDASVWKSHLKGNAVVEDNAYVRESTLQGRCRVLKSARIVSSEVSGVYATGESRVLRSKLISEVSEYVAFMLEDKAELTACEMTYVAPKWRRIRFNGETKLIECTLMGRRIEFDGKTFVKHSNINGESFFFNDVEYVHGLELSGKQVSFKDVNKLINVTMKDVSTVDINGKLVIRSTSIEGENIELDGNDISIEQSSINGKLIRIEDTVKLKEVDVFGFDIHLSDFVSIEGKKEDRVYIGDEVHMQDLVRINIGEKRKPMRFIKVKLSGDMFLTGI